MGVGPIINRDVCTRCGKCAADCARQLLAVVDDAMVMRRDDCMLCAHCYAVCPTGAITFDPAHLLPARFRTFAASEKAPAAGAVDAATFAGVVLSRRSVRRYKNLPVSPEALADLVEFAARAPSGSNCKNWEFSAAAEPADVAAVRRGVVEFYRRLNRLARNPVLRTLSVALAGRRLIAYRRERLARLEFMVKQADAGRDLFFWGAPAVVVIHGPVAGSTPREDGQYAACHLTLLAQALGLGTCFIGYAREAVARDAGLRARLGIPKHHAVHAVLTVGHPNVEYQRLPLNKPVRVHWAKSPGWA